MTTVAYKDGVMAADSKVTQGRSTITFMDKIIQKNGYVFGISGCPAACTRVVDWVAEHGLYEADNSRHKRGDFDILVWYKNQLYSLDNELYPIRLNKNKPHTLGTGADVAMGALMAGATVKQAVEIAVKIDVYTGGKIKVVTLPK